MNIKGKKLEEDKVLFKAIEEEKTCMKAKYKASTNFASTKWNNKPKEGSSKRNKEFVKWPKCKKCGCQHVTNPAYKNANEKCDKYDKKDYISYFHNSYTCLYKRKTLA